MNLWGESIKCAAYLYNRTQRKNGIPANLWYNVPVDYSKIKTFGSVVFAKVNKPLGKLDDRCKKMLMVGYASNCYRLFDSETKRIVSIKRCTVYTLNESKKILK